MRSRNCGCRQQLEESRCHKTKHRLLLLKKIISLADASMNIPITAL